MLTPSFVLIDGVAGVARDQPPLGRQDGDAEDRLEIGLVEAGKHHSGVIRLETRPDVDLAVAGVHRHVARPDRRRYGAAPSARPARCRARGPGARGARRGGEPFASGLPFSTASSTSPRQSTNVVAPDVGGRERDPRAWCGVRRRPPVPSCRARGRSAGPRGAQRARAASSWVRLRTSLMLGTLSRLRARRDPLLRAQCPRTGGRAASRHRWSSSKAYRWSSSERSERPVETTPCRAASAYRRSSSKAYRWSSSERSERSVETTAYRAASRTGGRAARRTGGRAASEASDQSRPPLIEQQAVPAVEQQGGTGGRAASEASDQSRPPLIDSKPTAAARRTGGRAASEASDQSRPPPQAT